MGMDADLAPVMERRSVLTGKTDLLLVDSRRITRLRHQELEQCRVSELLAFDKTVRRLLVTMSGCRADRVGAEALLAFFLLCCDLCTVGTCLLSGPQSVGIDLRAAA